MSAMDWGRSTPKAPQTYDAYLGPAMFEPLALATADAVEVGPGEAALDVACGTGVLTRVLAERVGSDGRVVGLDLSEGMLAVARGRGSTGAPIDYVQGRAEQLPFAESEFAVVTCQQGLQFVPDRPAVLAEFKRVLAPGGRLGVACWEAIDHQANFDAIARSLDRHFGTDVGDIQRVPFRLSDPAELRALLVAAGFGDVVVEIERVAARFPDPANVAPLTIGSSPVAAAFAAGSDQQRAAVTAEVACELEAHREGDTIAFEMPSLIAVALA